MYPLLKRILCIWIVLLFAYLNTHAQQVMLDSLLKTLPLTKQDTNRLKLLCEISTEYWFSNPQKSIEYGREAEALATEFLEDNADDKLTADRLATAENAIGVAYYIQGDYDKALEYYLKALKTYESLNNQEGIGHSFNNIGLIYFNQKDYDKALEYHTKALKVREKMNDKVNIGASLNNLGEVYDILEKYDEALNYFQRFLKIAEELEDEVQIGVALNNIGLVYKEKGKYEEALSVLFKALEVQERNNMLLYKTQCLNFIASTYSELKNINLALEYAEKSLKLAQQLNAKTEIKQASSLLTSLYKEKKDYEKAFFYQELMVVYKDSLFNEEMTEKITHIQSQYELDKKEKQIEILEKNKAINKLVLWSSIGGFSLIIIIGFLAFSRHQLKVKKDRLILKEEQQILEAQKELAETKLQNSQLKQQQLQQELGFRNKTITTHALNIIQKNEILNDLREAIQDILNTTTKDSQVKFTKLIRLIDYSFHLDKDWEEFKLYFEQVHTNFFENLKEQYPELTPNDLKLCALLKLNMNMKQAATILGISAESVKMARHRLRKKLNMATEENLTEFFGSF